MNRTLLAMGVGMLPAEMERLEQNFDVIKLWKERDPEAVLQARAKDIQAISSVHYVPISRTMMEGLPNLEIISQFAVGFDNIDVKTAQERGIAVTNTPDVLTNDTADTALALLLAVARRVCEGDMYVRVGKWLNGPMPLGVSLGNKVAGIIGMGRIGQAIAKRCEAFGMTIHYHGPREKVGVPYVYEPDLAKMAAKADFLIAACPGGEKTRHLVNHNILQALGSKGILINIARGTVVDEDALVKALSEKTIAGAGLDVFLNEPHVPKELITMDHVVLLPHVGSATFETRTVMGRLVIENLLAHFKGDPLLTPVRI